MRSVVMLAMICIGGMELLFCRIADPELFDRIVTPVISYSQTAWSHTVSLLGTKAAELKDFAVALTAPPPVEIPESAQIAGAQTADLALTELITRQDKDVLVGGNIDMVFYEQSGEVWGAQPYGTDDIGKYGCGPTAMSMIVSSMTVYDVDPAQMAVWAVENGYWAPKSGSYQSIIPGAAQNYGLTCTTLVPQGAQALREELMAGGIVVALMGKGNFTEGGHFIVLRGVTLSGDILVADPNSQANSLQTWDAQLILDELATGRENTLWHITA